MIDKIIYQPRKFGIYGLMSMSIVQCIYAIKFSEYTNTNIDKSFLIKNGRKPTKIESDYINRVLQGEEAPHGVYKHNWIVYSSQNLLLEHPRLLPSTSTIRKIIEKTYKHSVDSDTVNLVAALSRNQTYSLDNGYYGVNTWQPLSISKALDSLNLKKDKRSISLLFNKIYKRDPIEEEISICKKVVFTCSQDIQNEIENTIEVKIKSPVSSRSPK